MSIPTPALLAFVVLIGWPLVQLASTLYLRRHRRQMKELARELRADPRYQGQDLRLIDSAVRDARPQPAMYFMPFFVFFSACGRPLTDRNSSP